MQDISKISWRDYIEERQRSRRFLMAVVFFILCSLLCSVIVNFVDQRSGYMLYDPLHKLDPVDFTYAIVGIEYFCILFTLAHVIKKPGELIFGLYCYAFLMLLRSITLYSVALSAPQGIIPLRDPLVQVFTGGVSFQLNDLFFSGHTAFCFINFFLLPKGYSRYVILICSLLIGSMLIIQRVHYSWDVLFAFAACYMVYQGSKRYLPMAKIS